MLEKPEWEYRMTAKMLKASYPELNHLQLQELFDRGFKDGEGEPTVDRDEYVAEVEREAVEFFVRALVMAWELSNKDYTKANKAEKRVG